MNIKQKLTWAFAMIACVPILIVAAIVIINLRHQALAGFADNSGREIRQIDNAMQLFFEGIEQNVEYLAAHALLTGAGNDMKSFLGPDPRSIALTQTDRDLFDLFSGLAASHPAYTYLSYSLGNGNYVQWPLDDSMSNFDARISAWYKKAMANPGKTLRSDAYFYARDQVALVSTIRAVPNALGNPGGVMNIDVSLKQLTGLVQQIHLGDSGYLMLVENTGTVLVDPRQPGHRCVARTKPHNWLAGSTSSWARSAA